MSAIVYPYQLVADRLGPDREWWASLNPMIPIVTTFQKALYNPSAPFRWFTNSTDPIAPVGTTAAARRVPSDPADPHPDQPASIRGTSTAGPRHSSGRRFSLVAAARRAVAVRPARGQLRRGDLSRWRARPSRSIDVTKLFKLYREKAKSAKERVIRAGRNPYDALLGAARHQPRGRRGRDRRRCSATTARGKSTLLKCVAGTLRPTIGRDHHPGPAGRPARARRRLPPRPHRPGERLPQRLDPRLLARARSTRIFDDIVEFAELDGVHRQAGEALLVGHVRPARLRGRDQRRARHPAGRRGAVGRRRGVPAQVPRPGAAASSARAARSCS